MNILFTGATGVIGRKALPMLTAAGHTVTSISRSDDEAAWLTSEGARPLALDLFDAAAVRDAAAGTDVVIHFATAIPPLATMTKRESWDLNDRLRSEATRNLVDAATAVGAQRFIQESITFTYADGGDDWITESSPIDPTWDVLESALVAERHVDRFTRSGGSGVTLRLGRLYGPGRASGDYIAAVAARKVPIIGKGRNYVSSIHVEDVATAVLESLTVAPGTYNVVDDDPVTASVLTGSLAKLLGAAPPRRVPTVVGRIAVGKATGLLTTSQRVSNGAFTSATTWKPMYPSIVDGWERIVHGTQRRHHEAA